jgi:hypothetical protein
MKGKKNTIVDLTGQRFGKWTVIKRVPDKTPGRPLWLCHCDCGVEKIVNGASLRQGRSRGCGCLRNKKLSERATKHGLIKSSLYSHWKAMKARCYNPKNIRYDRYGSRGIKVCDRWLDFNNFYIDLHESYAEGLTIERIDNNGNYSPENVRWASLKEQARNKSTNRSITFNGETHLEIEWETILNIPARLISKRLGRGWPVEEALSTPILKKGFYRKHLNLK